jgi:molybdopterin synthase sulfur carrier subunit
VRATVWFAGVLRPVVGGSTTLQVELSADGHHVGGHPTVTDGHPTAGGHPTAPDGGATDGAVTLNAVLDALASRFPGLNRRLRDERGELRRYINIYVDGEECRWLAGADTPVPNGAEIRLIPSVAGG